MNSTMEAKVTWPKLLHFTSRLLFGGAIDHVILAVLGRAATRTVYRPAWSAIWPRLLLS
jgi:hypothetical protein